MSDRSAPLPPDDVRIAREKHAENPARWTPGSLALALGSSADVIYRALRGQTFADAGGPIATATPRSGPMDDVSLRRAGREPAPKFDARGAFKDMRGVRGRKRPGGIAAPLYDVARHADARPPVEPHAYHEDRGRCRSCNWPPRHPIHVAD